MPPKKADKKKKAKLPAKKAIEKQVADLEAAADERKEVRGHERASLVLSASLRRKHSSLTCLLSDCEVDPSDSCEI